MNGTIHTADAVAAQAQHDANIAFNFLAGEPCNTILTGQDLGGLTLVPGVYGFASSAQLTGTLTLNGQGNPNAVFIFKIGSTLITASNASVVLVNGATACNVFFQVGSSATLGTGTQFIGNIFALASVTLTTNVTVSGRAIGLNGAVTLDSNVVSAPSCVAVPNTGFLQICKVAGAGISAGTNFTFSAAGTTVVVPAGPAPGGTCSTPMGVPAGAVVITETVPTGIALTSVSTLPGGALVSSNLAAGVATVTVTAGGQTIVTFLDTLIPVVPTTGLLQICKIAGAGVTVGTPFTFSVAGSPVVVTAGAAPGGSCGTPMVVTAGATVVTETLPSGIALTSVSTLPSGALASSNLAAGAATVTVTAGGQTIVTFLDTAIPVVPTTGFLQICKIAGASVAVGTPFTYTVGGASIIVPAGAAPGGNCGTAMVVNAGPTLITEILPAGTALTSVTTLPSGALVSSSLAGGTATVTVTAGGQTIVTFLNTLIPVVPTTGLLQICKVAGGGVASGTNFTFTVAGVTINVPAGAAPGGTCSTPVVVPAGAVVIAETLPSGIALTSVSTLPSGALVSSNLAAGTAGVTVAAGGQTIATFVDTLIPVVPTTGLLQICKVAGGGVASGTNFTFTVAGATVIVPAGPAPGGTCGTPMVVTAGPTVVTETLPSGIALTSVSTLPSGALVSSNLATGAVTVTVAAGGQTIVSFLDTAIPVIPTTGFLQICKIAGAGVAAGTPFTFTIAGTSVIVSAGSAPGGTCGTPIVLPAGTYVTSETLPPGTTLSSVTTLPGGALVSSNLAAGAATVTVSAGGQTIVTFLNTVVPAPVFGLLKLCKIAGSGVTAGTPYIFSVGGGTFSVPAGYCVVAGSFAVGTQLTATETIPTGGQVTAISVMPPNRIVSVPNLAAGSVTFTIGSGVTEVSFTNTGTVIVPPNPPTADSVNPNSGAGFAQNFSFKYSSANGFGYLTDVYALFRQSINGAGACFVVYDKPTNSFYLYNDAGTGISAPLAPGAGGSLANSQCTLTGAGSTVSGSGNTLTMNLNLTFNSSFGGPQNIFMYASDAGSMASGWQNRGTWTVPIPAAPTADSVAPAAGSGLAQSFTFKYSSVNGFGYLNDVYALFRQSLNGAGACLVVYDKPSNAFYLYNDAGNGLLGPLAPGSAGSLSNSQCTLNGTGSSIGGAGNTLTVVLNLAFNGSFAGPQTIWKYALDQGGLSSGWNIRGTWTVQ